MSDQYDVVIIGAGIGGLSAGNFLARAGMKVLIIEQHYKVGGYCSSFERRGYRFDVGVHSLGSLRKGGHFYRVLNDLGLEIKTTRPEITNYLRCPGYEIPIYKDFDRTIEYLKSIFPEDSTGLGWFLEQMDRSFASLYPTIKDKSFKDILDANFTSVPLKYILSLLLGNLGSVSGAISALAAFGLFREFIADGGYYPEGGMQVVADIFADSFKKSGGNILLRTQVEQILVENGHVHGVRCSDGSYIPAKVVVSNAAALHTFVDLLRETKIASQYMDDLKKLEYTTSVFIVYLGIARDMRALITPHCNQWMLRKFDLFYSSYCFSKGGFDDFLVCYTPSFHTPGIAPEGKDCIILITGSPYSPLPGVEAKEYWKQNKEQYGEKVIRFFMDYTGDFKDAIEVKEIATPHTLFRYTSNTDGSIYGWTPTVKQFGFQRLAPETPVKGLYIVGQWTRPGPGISMVSQSGRLVSNLILSR